MAKKTEQKRGTAGETLGISGFTLGIVGIVILVLIPLIGSFGILLIWFATPIVGLVLCIIQQRKKPTRLGKAGIIINIIVFVLSIVILIVLVNYALPIAQQEISKLNLTG